MSLSQSNIDAMFDQEPTPAKDPAPAAQGHTPQATGPRRPNLAHILGLSVPVTVVLATRSVPIETILKTRVGTILEFEVAFDTDLVMEVAGHPVALGQAVKIGENFGLRIGSVGTVEDRIHAMGGA